MKIQYASDLHLEFEENEDFIRQFPLEVAGDILVLAGDTCYLGKGVEYLKDSFFKWCSDNYKETYLLPGNHEYYGGYPLDKTLNNWQLDIYPNVHYLNNRSVRIGDYELFFTTLWTYICPDKVYEVRRVMNDFRNIGLSDDIFSPSTQNRINGICRSWLTGALRSSDAIKKIVVTHHCPIQDPMIEKHVGRMSYPAYADDQTSIMYENGPDYWIHGHIHTNLTNGMKKGSTTILSNNLGYVDDEENAGFNRKAVIEI